MNKKYKLADALKYFFLYSISSRFFRFTVSVLIKHELMRKRSLSSLAISF